MNGAAMQALVIDDDSVCRLALSHVLAGFDLAQVIEADSGELAWQLMADGLRPDVCCCDVQMPGMSGLELLCRMKADPELADIPVLLVSGESRLETIQEALQIGSAAFLSKPLHTADGRERLRAVLDKVLDEIAEHPAATLERLRIGAARLCAYLGAYEAQAREQIEPLLALLAAGRHAEAKERIEALRKGGHTLGLWKAAGKLDRLAAGAVEPQRLRATLAAVADAAAKQAGRVAGKFP